MQNAEVLIRIVHIFAAVMVGGAAFYQLIAVRPALLELDEASRQKAWHGIARRWFGMVITLLVVLLATGLYNFIAIRVPALRGKPSAGLYHALFGVKFLAVLAAFHAATVLSLPGARGDRWRARGGFWLPFLGLMITIAIVLGGLLTRFETVFSN
ncbi:MAG: hypothetical protein JNG88_13100 [Phycisphaerales bacterium]|nr:hypothetical protein [Phycisphaerales bacterium]